GSFGYLEEARLPMPWGGEQDRDLFAYYRALIQFRCAHPCLVSGGWLPGSLSSDTFTYIRSDADERLLVAINLAEEPRRLQLPGSWSSVCFSTHPSPSLMPGEAGASLDLGPLTGAVIR
ncbi:MAG TPA: DUF3459 domain-containing protein, partial [Anaerolineaceae bacterium]|nr:DUF3459 domain-containing protein [Anaerolineaceae bacterium]